MRAGRDLTREFEVVEQLLKTMPEPGFVNGHKLAAVIGVDLKSLPYRMQMFSRSRPALRIESKSGSGYRLAREDRESCRDVQSRPCKPPPAINANNRTQAVRMIEDLVPDLVEAMRQMALRDGGGIDGAARRLLYLGWEVERDLMASGERP